MNAVFFRIQQPSFSRKSELGGKVAVMGTFPTFQGKFIIFFVKRLVESVCIQVDFHECFNLFLQEKFIQRVRIFFVSLLRAIIPEFRIAYVTGDTPRNLHRKTNQIVFCPL